MNPMNPYTLTLAFGALAAALIWIAAWLRYEAPKPPRKPLARFSDRFSDQPNEQ